MHWASRLLVTGYCLNDIWPELSIFASGPPLASRPQQLTTNTILRLICVFDKKHVLSSDSCPTHLLPYFVFLWISTHLAGRSVPETSWWLSLSLNSKERWGNPRIVLPITSLKLCSLACLWFSSIQEGECKKSHVTAHSSHILQFSFTPVNVYSYLTLITSSQLV